MTESELIWKQYNSNKVHVGNGIQDLPVYPMPQKKTDCANNRSNEKEKSTYVK